MADYAPTDVARMLGIEGATLRKYAQEFAAYLSPGAAASGPKVRRRYTDSDIALLRDAQARLAAGATYAQVRALLAGSTNDQADTPHVAQRPAAGSVEIIQPGDQAAALQSFIAAQRELIESQQRHIAEQALLVEQLRNGSDQQGQLIEHQAAQLDQAHAQIEATRADLVGQLEAVRVRLGKIPRWLRALFGATEE